MNEIQIIKATQKLVETELAAKFRTIEKEDLVSDAFLWLSAKGRIERLQRIVAEETEKGFFAYVRLSLSNLFARAVVKQNVNWSNELSSSFELNAGLNGPVVDSAFYYSFETFRDLMARKEFAEKVLGLPEITKGVTGKQLAALKLVYIEKLPTSKAYKVSGATYGGFQDRKYKGLRNLFLSWNEYTAAVGVF